MGQRLSTTDKYRQAHIGCLPHRRAIEPAQRAAHQELMGLGQVTALRIQELLQLLPRPKVHTARSHNGNQPTPGYSIHSRPEPPMRATWHTTRIPQMMTTTTATVSIQYQQPPIPDNNGNSNNNNNRTTALKPTAHTAGYSAHLQTLLAPVHDLPRCGHQCGSGHSKGQHREVHPQVELEPSGVDGVRGVVGDEVAGQVGTPQPEERAGRA
jgi:hypothetical protein